MLLRKNDLWAKPIFLVKFRAWLRGWVDPCLARVWLCDLARLPGQILIDSYVAITWSEATRQGGLTRFLKVGQPGKTG